jgi:hypothetical protein
MNDAILEKLSDRTIHACTLLMQTAQEGRYLQQPEERHGKKLLRQLHDVVVTIRKLARVHTQCGEIRLKWRKDVKQAQAEIEERQAMEAELQDDGPSMDFEEEAPSADLDDEGQRWASEPPY